MKRYGKEAGFSLAALIFFAAAASIVAAAAVPAYQMQAKREREMELLFRGQEYTRAIQKYQRKFGAYPSSIDQLLQTNGLRFLRKPYKDPVTGKDFRLIRINPDGSLNGSKLFVQNANNQPLFGNTQTFGQPQQQSPSQANTQQFGQQQGIQQPIPSQQFGQQQGPSTAQQPQQPSPSQPFGQPQQPSPSQPFGQPQQPSPSQPFGQSQQPSLSQPFGQSQAAPGGLGSFAPTANSGTPVSGGPVVGVASDSEEKSVMIYNKRQKYNEWEFIAITSQLGPQGQPQPPVQTQGGQPQANPFSGPGPATPFGQRGGPAPFGPAGGSTPFGPGSQPNQQPFGSSNPAVPANPFSPSAPGRLQ